MKRIAVVAALVGLAFPAVAGAKIVINRGMFGVSLGATMKQVRAKLGKASEVQRFQSATTWWYAGRDLTVNFGGKPLKVTSLFTENRKERTANGVGVGSSESAVKRLVPGVDCSTTPDAGTHCLVPSPTSLTLFTSFHIGSKHKVDDVFISA